MKEHEALARKLYWFVCFFVIMAMFGFYRSSVSRFPFPTHGKNDPQGNVLDL